MSNYRIFDANGKLQAVIRAPHYSSAYRRALLMFGPNANVEYQSGK